MRFVIGAMCSLIAMCVHSQTIEHKWKASSITMFDKFYDLKDADNVQAQMNFIEDMRQLNKLDTLSKGDSLAFLIGYNAMMKIGKDLNIEFTKKGKVTIEGDIKWGKEIYKEGGSYDIVKDRITTDLKDSKCTSMVIVSLTDTELVLGNMLGSDKILVKFVRSD